MLRRLPFSIPTLAFSPPASTALNTCRRSVGELCLSGALAKRAIKGVAGRLHLSLDRCAALRAALTRPIVNPQPLLVVIRRAGGAAEIEQPIARPLAGVIERHGAAARNGLPDRKSVV